MFRVTTNLKLNHASIQKKISQALANSAMVKRASYTKAYGIFTQAKRIMLSEFDRHLITQELLGGPSAINMSGTLDGYGNLFSFIGFEVGSNPTEELRQLLELGTNLHATSRQRRTSGGRFASGLEVDFSFSVPSQEQIAKATPMPWERGNSWAYGVETFISGLSAYMYKRWANGRSGMGFQLPYENLEDASFSSTPYITEILQNFRQRVNTIGR